MNFHSKPKILAPRGKFKRRFSKAITLAEAAKQLLQSQEGEDADLPPKIIDSDLWRPEKPA